MMHVSLILLRFLSWMNLYSGIWAKSAIKLQLLINTIGVASGEGSAAVSKQTEGKIVFPSALLPLLKCPKSCRALKVQNLAQELLHRQKQSSI